jgi:glutaryl-CoA dehydrogenase
MKTQSPFELFSIDSLLDDEERAIRDVVRDFVDTRIKPEIADWFEAGQIPARELARELGQLGVLGMHLEGYGCQGTSAVAYGLACLELEAGDSGIRSLVSVQGSLAMYAIHAFGSEEQKQQWLPGMAAGEKIGCFGLTDRTSGRTPAACSPTPSGTATTGSSTARRCGSRTAMWPTSLSCGHAPTRASVASSSPPTPRVSRRT